MGMTNTPRFGCREYLLRAYQNAQSFHGKLDLDYDSYLNHLLPIINKYLGGHPEELLIIKFLSEVSMDRIRSMASRAFANAFILGKKKGDHDG